MLDAVGHANRTPSHVASVVYIAIDDPNKHRVQATQPGQRNDDHTALTTMPPGHQMGLDKKASTPTGPTFVCKYSTAYSPSTWNFLSDTRKKKTFYRMGRLQSNS